MPRFVRYMGKSPLTIKGLTLDTGWLINLDNLSEETRKTVEEWSKEFREIPENELTLIDQIKYLLWNRILAYDYAEIRGAVVKGTSDPTLATARDIWDAYIIKIVLRRKDENEETKTPPKILLERRNFLIFKEYVDLKCVETIIESVVNTERFKIGGCSIRCHDGHFEEDYFCQSSWGERFGLSWSSKVYSYRVREKPNVPEKLALKTEGFQDFNHAIRELMEFRPFEHGSFSDKSIILVLPYYPAKISRCEMREKRLVVDIEAYDEVTTIENLKCWYYYRRLPSSSDWLSERGEKEGRGEISPLKWHNEVELPLVPNLADVTLFHDGFEEPIDEYHMYLEKGMLPRRFDTYMELPEMFEDLKRVLEKAGFEDANGKIVLAAATNLMEVVVTKKLQDLRANIDGSLNNKIKRVIEEIREKEHREIERQLITDVIKVARDKLDHEGFRLFVENIDAGFLLKRTIDFLHMLYP